MSDSSLASYTNGNSWMQLQGKDLLKTMKWAVAGKVDLNDQEFMSWMIFAKQNELSPFNGESYCIPRVGPVAGIRGIEIKAQAELNKEAERAGILSAYYSTEERQIPWEDYPGCVFGDIIFEVKLTDFITSRDYNRLYHENYRFFKDMNPEMTHGQIEDIVVTAIGEKPCWTGIGIVYASEDFKGTKKHDKYPRAERAIKRGKKAAITKRFPRLSPLTEPSMVKRDDGVIQYFDDPELEAPVYIEGDYSEESITDALFGADPAAPAPAAPIQKSVAVPRESLASRAENVTSVRGPDVAGIHTRPYTPERLKNFIADLAAAHEGKTFPKESRWTVTNALEHAVGKDRRELCGYLTGKTSTKSPVDEKAGIEDKYMFALSQWLDANDKQVPSEMAKKEAQYTVTEARKQNGQLELI